MGYKKRRGEERRAREMISGCEENKNYMAAGLDNSLTQPCPGSSSSPDGSLICCRENRPRHTRLAVPVCVFTCYPYYVALCAPHRECVIALAPHSSEPEENLNPF